MSNNTKITIERFGKKEDSKEFRARRIRKCGRFVGALIIFAVLFFLVIEVSICVQNRLEITASNAYINGEVDSIWLSSVPSYWGGIIGGMISGAIACIGVYFTIRYYKESDQAKERAQVLPFMMATLDIGDKKPTKSFELGKRPEKPGNKKIVRVRFTNIGNGFACTSVVRTNTIGGESYIDVFPVESYDVIALVADVENLRIGMSFELQYADSLTNEYIQKYDIWIEDKEIRIQNGYPNLLPN